MIREKHWHKCRTGSSCCFCCCSERGATITLAIVGLLLSVVFILPPFYVYYRHYNSLDGVDSFINTGQQDADGGVLINNASSEISEIRSTSGENDDERGRENTSIHDIDYKVLFPILDATHHMVNYFVEEYKSDDASSGNDLDDDSNVENEIYRLAVIQLINDTQSNAAYLTLISFVVGCINIPIHLLLFIGAVLHKPDLLVPWLIFTLLQHIILGIPVLTFTAIISLFLAAQTAQCLLGFLIMLGMVFLFGLAISTWITVYSCHSIIMKKKHRSKHGRHSKRSGFCRKGSSDGDDIDDYSSGSSSSSAPDIFHRSTVDGGGGLVNGKMLNQQHASLLMMPTSTATPTNASHEPLLPHASNGVGGTTYHSSMLKSGGSSRGTGSSFARGGGDLPSAPIAHHYPRV